MKTSIGVLVAGGLVLAACAKGGSGGAGADGAATVRAFVEAISAGELDRARSYLPDDAACAKAPADKIDRCKQGAAAMRAQVDSLGDDFPRGAKVTKVTPSPEPSPDPMIAMWTVDLDGKPGGDMMTITLDGRYYAAFPVRIKE